MVGTEVVSGCGRNGIFGNGNGRNGILGNLNFGNLSFGNLSFGNEKVGSLMGKVGAEANNAGIAIAGCGASATRSAVSERWRWASSRLLPLVVEGTDNCTSTTDRTINKLLAMDEIRKISFCLSVYVWDKLLSSEELSALIWYIYREKVFKDPNSEAGALEHCMYMQTLIGCRCSCKLS